MGFKFSAYNNSFNQFKQEPDENAGYFKPSEMVEKNGIEAKYEMICCYINNKGKFGKHPVAGCHVITGVEEDFGDAFTENVWLSLPQHLTEIFEKILNDEKAVNAINNGECVFKLKKLHTKKYDKDFFTVEFVDD